MANSTGVTLLVIGLIFGPGYYVYSHFFSGQVAASHPLPISNHGAGSNIGPAQIELSPTMGKIGLILRFQTSHDPVMSIVQMPQNKYRATLRTGKQTVFDKQFTLTSSSVESEVILNFSEAMPVFEADTSGTYQLEISQMGEAGMNLVSAEAQVRKNIVAPSNTLMTAGFGMLAAGVAMLIF